MNDRTLKLKEPPIIEVVCGFVFEPVPGLSILDLGVYAETRRKDYPKRELQPALVEGGPVFQLGAPPLRAWLIDPADEFLVQLQPDRLYLNWRARGAEYPCFSDDDGTLGIKNRALDELETFTNWLALHSKVQGLSIRRVELTKINMLERGRHWTGYGDLSKLLSVASVFQSIQASEPARLDLRFQESVGASDMSLAISMLEPGLRVETRQTTKLESSKDASECLEGSNRRLNDVFFGLISKSELGRFGGIR